MDTFLAGVVLTVVVGCGNVVFTVSSGVNFSVTVVSCTVDGCSVTLKVVVCGTVVFAISWVVLMVTSCGRVVFKVS